MEIDDKIFAILCKKLSSNLTTEEKYTLECWRKDSRRNDLFLTMIEDRRLVEEDLRDRYAFMFKDSNDNWIGRLSINVHSRINGKKSNIIEFLYRNSNSIRRIVALIVIFLFLGFIINKYLWQEPRIISLEDVLPTKGQSYIKLSTGRLITLDSNKVDLIAGSKLMYEDGELLYEFGNDTLSQIELTTSIGGRYNLTLPDGTKVWLNADSKLIYPSKFSGENRVVELEGEAYFDVEPFFINGVKKPFVVKTASQNIEVLGTEFNISAYKDASADITTLVEGSIMIKSNEKVVFVKPGEQTFVTKNNITKREVDVDVYKAWVNNVFYFSETPLEEALNVITRWYGVELIRSISIPNTHLYGTISREHGLKEVIRIMEQTGLKFTLQQVNNKKQLIVSN